MALDLLQSTVRLALVLVLATLLGLLASSAPTPFSQIYMLCILGSGLSFVTRCPRTTVSRLGFHTRQEGSYILGCTLELRMYASKSLFLSLLSILLLSYSYKYVFHIMLVLAFYPAHV
jgi:hypothetical protein